MGAAPRAYNQQSSLISRAAKAGLVMLYLFMIALALSGLVCRVATRRVPVSFLGIPVPAVAAPVQDREPPRRRASGIAAGHRRKAHEVRI